MLVHGLIHQLALRARALGRRPAYAITIVITLGVGIGASTAIFSVIRGTVLRPLPYPAPERLVRVRDRYVPTGGGGTMSVADYLDLQQATHTLADLSAFRVGSVNLATEEAPVRARSLTVTANFFRSLGVAPAIGRGFRAGEDRADAARVAVIGDRLWREQFGGRPDVIGRPIELNAERYTIVGVMPASFWFPGRPAIIVPYAWSSDDLASRGNRLLEGLARLAPGVTSVAAQSELGRIYATLASQYPEADKDWTVQVTPAVDWMLGYERGSLWLLSGAVLLVLLIGCVNVANLMLVRAERRHREIALRAALGASRGIVMREFLIESVLLALVASAVGAALGWAGMKVLLSLFGGALPRAEEVTLGLPVLGFALGLALLTGVAVGLVPALRIDTAHVHDALREGGRGFSGRGSRLQQALVAVEVALAVVLVAGAGLLLNSFWRLNRVDTGIDPAHAFVFQIDLPGAAYDRARANVFFHQALERIGAVPGVHAVGITDHVPLEGGFNVTTVASPDAPDLAAKFVEIRGVSPDFFRAAGIPLLRGRSLPADDATQGHVVVISDELARTLFPHGDAVGRHIDLGWSGGGYDVVGVVGSVREFGVARGKRPAIYWTYPYPSYGKREVFVVRTAGANPLAVLPQIRSVLHGLDPALPIFGVATMEDVVLQTIGNRWFATALFVAFGMLALGLSALGIFGVLAYVVEQRTREMGIRMALGATAGAVRAMVVRQALRLVVIGLALGLAGAVFASRVLSSLLYQVHPTDPATFGVVAVVALGASMLASYLPAYRASRVEPIEVMRDE